MSNTEKVILTNMCMIEDDKGNVVMQYRSPERYAWSGIAFPGGEYVIIMIGANTLLNQRFERSTTYQ